DGSALAMPRTSWEQQNPTRPSTALSRRRLDSPVIKYFSSMTCRRMSKPRDSSAGSQSESTPPWRQYLRFASTSVSTELFESTRRYHAGATILLSLLTLFRGLRSAQVFDASNYPDAAEISTSLR